MNKLFIMLFALLFTAETAWSDSPPPVPNGVNLRIFVDLRY